MAGPERRLMRFRHPTAGPLTLRSTSLLMADDPMIRVVILYPASASDSAKLERLARHLVRIATPVFRPIAPRIGLAFCRAV